MKKMVSPAAGEASSEGIELDKMERVKIWVEHFFGLTGNLLVRRKILLDQHLLHVSQSNYTSQHLKVRWI